MNLLPCARCLKELDENLFYRNKNRSTGRNAICKDCSRETHREYRTKKGEEYKAKNRANNAKFAASPAGRLSAERKKAARYGLSLDEYNEVLSRNGGMCMICNDEVSTCLDHCHYTGVVRGALCRMCNVGLGNFRDSVTNLNSAIQYLNAAAYPLADNE